MRRLERKKYAWNLCLFGWQRFIIWEKNNFAAMDQPPSPTTNRKLKYKFCYETHLNYIHKCQYKICWTIIIAVEWDQSYNWISTNIYYFSGFSFSVLWNAQFEFHFGRNACNGTCCWHTKTNWNAQFWWKCFATTIIGLPISTILCH